MTVTTVPGTTTFITVLVDEHDELPEGCCMRFKGIGVPRPVLRVRHARENTDGSPVDHPREAETVWLVESPQTTDAPSAAWGVTVEDSGAGTSVLVYGGSRGLRLHPDSGGEPIAEPYLLLADEAVVEWGQ